MRFLWISGWAVPPAWLAEQARAAFPQAVHIAVSPSEAANTLTQEQPDVLGGYSLGALWLLMHAQDFPQTMPVVLLAPIFSFAAENGDGGKMTLTQLRLQRRRLRKDARTAVTDFYRLSGLENIAPAAKDFTAEEITVLDTELGWLENWRAINPPPSRWQGLVGDKDALLDPEILQKKWPGLQIVANTGHEPGPLLKAASKIFSAKASS